MRYHDLPHYVPDWKRLAGNDPADAPAARPPDTPAAAPQYAHPRTRWRNAVPVLQPWRCERCAAIGTLECETHNDSVACWDAIAVLHAAASPNCHAQH